MTIPKNYFHDRLVLFLVSVNVFMIFLCMALILLRMGGAQGGEGYIVQYRSNLGISAFKTGNMSALLSFIGFAVVVGGVNILLSIRSYNLRRELSLTILGLGSLLLLLAIIVSNALLVLR